MRSLNLLKQKLAARAKVGWQHWQKTQIQQKSALLEEPLASLRAVFPGSMLFNQILIPGSGNRITYNEIYCRPESLNVVYEYCSHIHKDNKLRHSLLIDTGESVSIDSVDAILDILKREDDIEQIVFLGKSARNSIADLLVGRVDHRIKFTVLEPNWNSVYSLHALYRQARHTIFIDTMRVMDAAYTGCKCSLLASTEFREDQAFELYLCHLQRVACRVSDPNGNFMQSLSGAVAPAYLVAENRMLALKAGLAATDGVTINQPDWLQSSVTAPDLLTDAPVIESNSGAFSHSIDSFRDRKTRIARKWVKLQEDPIAFFNDSNSRVLKKIARVLPQKIV